MGLTICKRIIDRYGGDIWFDSTAYQGATFSFKLPVTIAAADDSGAAPKAVSVERQRVEKQVAD